MVNEKILICTDSGETVEAMSPVIISASRSTDIPAFYSKWFFDRINKGYCVWRNPFNQKPNYVSFSKCKAVVFWTKNPEPIIPYLSELEKRGICYYFHITLNDYAHERLEPNVPTVAERIDTFRRLATKIGKERVIWRFDPLLLSNEISMDVLLKRIGNIGRQLKGYTEKLVFSFIDIASYRKVQNNLVGFGVREFAADEQVQFAKGLAELNKDLGFELATCGELVDLSEYGIKHNKCVDDELMMRLFNDDAKLMEFIGAEYDMFNGWQIKKSKKDKGQRKACGCIVSKDIGAYNTCPHLCRYCYANSSDALVKKNFVQYRQNPYSESII